MNKDSPDGCYGTRCKDCELDNTEPGSEERDECRRLCLLAIDRFTQDDE